MMKIPTTTARAAQPGRRAISGCGRLLIAATVAAAAACDAGTGPSAAPTVDFTFNVPRGAFAPDFDAERSGSVITIQGTFARPCGPGYGASAKVTRQADVATLTVLGELVAGQPCTAEHAAPVRYDAIIRNAAGVDNVFVVHEGTGMPVPITVYEVAFR